MLTPGQRLRALRDQFGLTIREVENASIRIAAKRQNDDFVIPLSRLSDISFRNLIDPSEEAYLRSKLTAPEFRAIQRGRMLVAIQYVRSTAHNASLLLKFAHYARTASDPEIARAARELADSAVQLRVYSLLAILLFGIRYVFPSVPLRSSSIVASYGRMCDRMSGLTRIQAPTSVAEVEAAL